MTELNRRSRHQWTLFTSRLAPVCSRGFRKYRAAEVLSFAEEGIQGIRKLLMRVLFTRNPARRYDALVVVCGTPGEVIVFRHANKPVRYLANFLGLLNEARGHSESSLLLPERLAWKAATAIPFSKPATSRDVKDALHPVQHLVDAETQTTGDSAVAAANGAFQHCFLVPVRNFAIPEVELCIEAFQLFYDAHPEFSSFTLVFAAPNMGESAITGDSTVDDGMVRFCTYSSQHDLSRLYGRCYAAIVTAGTGDASRARLYAEQFAKPIIVLDTGASSTDEEGPFFWVCPTPRAVAERMLTLARNPVIALGKHRPEAEITGAAWNTLVERLDRMVNPAGATHLVHPAR